jgi:ABC-2 type transport system ATP-binding protein
MKRRLEIAMGIVHRPRVLFLDEPTTGLDPAARKAMWDELIGLTHSQSMSVLLTTHYLEEAEQLADRIAIINDGRVVVEGTPEVLKAGLDGVARPTLDDVYLHHTGRSFVVDVDAERQKVVPG